jgi:hypothetical protein
MRYLWKTLMAKLGIKLLFSSSSHPQTDGQIEVVNRSLGTLLWVLIKKNPKSWEECIPHAEFTYNRAEHSVTKQSPFEIVYGLNPPMTLDLLPLPLHECVNMDITKHADFMKNLHEDTHKTIEAHVTQHTTKIVGVMDTGGIPVHLLLGPIIGPSSAQEIINNLQHGEDPHEEAPREENDDGNR